MTPEQALDLITKVAEASNKGGILTIADAVNVNYALHSLKSAVDIAKQASESEVVEQPKSKK